MPENGSVAFVADDLGTWLVGLLADAGRKKLTALVLGSDQQRALRSAATAAARRTAEELCPDDDEQAQHVALVISQVFSEPVPDALLTWQETVLEELRTGIAGQLAVLDDASLTGTGQSSSQVLGVPGTVLAARLTYYLLQEVVSRGAHGGPLEPLANQLGHDKTYLQGQRIEGKIDQLDDKLLAVLDRLDEAHTAAPAPAGLAQLPPEVRDFTGGDAEQTGRLERVNLMPPGPARRGELAVYLELLIDWMNTDPWPQDRRFEGPALIPANFERKLQVITAAGEGPFDADELARLCRRLVILGGPGSGKTWLARRIARRSAEVALESLIAGASLDEVELPLYTTCSHLFSSPGGIRESVVSGALDHLGDLGGPRISTALRVFFIERSAPTLVVIDSLDEAHGSQERLRQAGTLPWRIVLTSRPSSWNSQLVIETGSEFEKIGELQPLQYPADVEPFIERWFTSRPEIGAKVAAQVAQQPGLQRAVTVPLILAFCCIVGGAEALPEFRHDLYAKALSRLLTGRWRGTDDSQPNVKVCLDTLRAWAWSGASSHPLSGVGMWVDDVPTEAVALSQADHDAVDHVAAPVSLPNVDTGITLRRFIHRSIREYLVAEHIARLPVKQAAEALLPHIWYDSDWEYAAPGALAMHPQRSEVLTHLIGRAAGSRQVPGDLSVIDGGWEFRRFLARVASETSEADWSGKAAGIIGTARLQLIISGPADDLPGATSWETSNHQAQSALLASLADDTGPVRIGKVVSKLIPVTSTAEDKRKVRQLLLRLLDDASFGPAAEELAMGLAQLNPTAREERHARNVLLKLLDWQGGSVVYLAGDVAALASTTEGKRQARQALLSILATHQLDGSDAGWLTDAVAELDPTTAEKRQACQALLGILARAMNGYDVRSLAEAIAKLDPTAADKDRARQAILKLLASQTDSKMACQMADGLGALEPTSADRCRARVALLELLTAQTDHDVAEELAGKLLQFACTPADKRSTRQVLLTLQIGQTDSWAARRFARWMARLEPTAADRRQARKALLALIAHQTDGSAAGWLADAAARLTPTKEEERQVRGALLKLLAGDTDSQAAMWLASSIDVLNPPAAERRQARQALMELLADQADGTVAAELAPWICDLSPTTADKRQLREALLKQLARQTDGAAAAKLARWICGLSPTTADKRQLREALLKQLARQTDGAVAVSLQFWISKLEPTADKHQAREVLLKQLASETDRTVARNLINSMADLDPTERDLRAWQSWAAPPPINLLSAARSNSEFAGWLAILPYLAGLSSRPN